MIKNTAAAAAAMSYLNDLPTLAQLQTLKLQK
jgi:hypothetical protein